jgi:hypothetical protein
MAPIEMHATRLASSGTEDWRYTEWMYWDGENRENAEACSHNNPGMSAGCPETSSLI